MFGAFITMWIKCEWELRNHNIFFLSFLLFLYTQITDWNVTAKNILSFLLLSLSTFSVSWPQFHYHNLRIVSDRYTWKKGNLLSGKGHSLLLFLFTNLRHKPKVSLALVSNRLHFQFFSSLPISICNKIFRYDAPNHCNNRSFLFADKTNHLHTNTRPSRDALRIKSQRKKLFLFWK